MSENRQILTLVGITLVIGIIALALMGITPTLGEGDAYVESYRVEFYPNGTLEEDYSYRLNTNENRFLFRVWDAPLSTSDPGQAYIEPVMVEAPNGAVGYHTNNDGQIHIYSDDEVSQDISRTISSLAFRNEAGAFKQGYYAPGIYDVSMEFVMHPPLEYDQDIGHLNIKFADEHIPYHNVEIVFVDADYIVEAYPHPPSYRMSREGDDLVITGSSGENALIEVELLMDRDAVDSFDGYPTQVDNVRQKTVDANRIVRLQHLAALGFYYGSRILVILIPLGLYGLYYIYGKEKEYTVPRYLSTIPNEDRKPWVVNQIFEDTALDYDDDGYYATLLDLHMRDIIEISLEDSKLRIKLTDARVNDPYEKRVMNFLRSLAEDGVVRSDRINELTYSIKEGEGETTFARNIKEQLVDLTTYVSEDMANEFISRGRAKLIPLIIFTGALFVGSIFLLASIPFEQNLVASSTIMYLVAIAQSGFSLLFPTTLFGRWKGETYKEKLEWDAFARHLKDFSRIKEYAPQDINMWGKWLVYGTALGEGKKVARAMEELDIELPAARFAPLMPVYWHPLVVATAPSKGRVSGFSGGGGGSFGGGGGFGGGGAGVR
jgi:uncharacterized membrane protein